MLPHLLTAPLLEHGLYVSSRFCLRVSLNFVETHMAGITQPCKDCHAGGDGSDMKIFQLSSLKIWFLGNSTHALRYVITGPGTRSMTTLMHLSLIFAIVSLVFLVASCQLSGTYSQIKCSCPNMCLSE